MLSGITRAPGTYPISFTLRETRGLSVRPVMLLHSQTATAPESHVASAPEKTHSWHAAVVQCTSTCLRGKVLGTPALVPGCVVMALSPADHKGV